MRRGAIIRVRRDAIALAILALLYLVVASSVSNSYFQLILSLVPIWALFGVSWNLLSGYGGQLSFGHASFFGIGAYTVALALIYLGLTPWIGIPLGALLGALAGIIIGMPTFRLRGHYFALAMLAYPLAILYVMEYLGFQEVSFPMHRDHPLYYLEFTDQRLYTVLAVALLAAGLVVCMLVENSRFGLVLMGIRQNELAAEAAGIDARRWKMRALVTSGAIAATAGGVYACVLLVLTPDSVFGILVSAQPVVVTLFGGVASIWGPVIGAAILVPLAESLNAELGNVIPGIQGVVYGAAIILIMLASPEGLFWTIRDRWFRRVLLEPAPVPVAPTPSADAHHDRSARELLRVVNLSRSFGGLRAVSQVNFSITEGEILGIIGPNGAGKTTLFNVLNGVLTADEGMATLDGVPMLGRKVHQVCRMGVGRTFQVVRSFPRLALLDNVVVGAYGAGLSDRAAVERALQALARVGLHRQSGALAGQLTNKELRLMELARALAGAPRLLLLDETLAGLGRDECD